VIQMYFIFRPGVRSGVAPYPIRIYFPGQCKNGKPKVGAHFGFRLLPEPDSVLSPLVVVRAQDPKWDPCTRAKVVPCSKQTRPLFQRLVVQFHFQLGYSRLQNRLPLHTHSEFFSLYRERAPESSLAKSS
jgi:hypothetical protein